MWAETVLSSSKLPWRWLKVTGLVSFDRHVRFTFSLFGGGGTFSKQVRHASGGPLSLLSPSPSLFSLPFPSLPLEVGPLPSLPPYPLSYSLSSPFRSKHTELRLVGLGECSSSPSGSGRSPAAKRILTHSRPKFALFWVSNAAYWYT